MLDQCEQPCDTLFCYFRRVFNILHLHGINMQNAWVVILFLMPGLIACGNLVGAENAQLPPLALDSSEPLVVVLGRVYDGETGQALKNTLVTMKLAITSTIATSIVSTASTSADFLLVASTYTNDSGFYRVIGTVDVNLFVTYELGGYETSFEFVGSYGPVEYRINALLDRCTSCLSCNDGILNQDEENIDCGGSCLVCPTCSDGIPNQDETGVDCGGSLCGPCPSCSDNIQNQNETGIDCGGICPACPVSETCSDGIQNQDETGVDCGGSLCGPCPSCSDNIQNQNETGIDCGGICPACPVSETCSDGIQNQDETGVDCGGSLCGPCPSCSDNIQNQNETGIDCGGVCPRWFCVRDLF